jgi:hypothetical protein
VNASLISGLSDPLGVAISGANLFVANFNSGTIGEYTTSGATVNTSLISGLTGPGGIAVSGSDLFVTNFLDGTVGEYTTSGATVNATLISGLTGPEGIAVSGSDLFVVNSGAGTIGEYTTSGATVDATLISGLDTPVFIAVAPGTPAIPNRVRLRSSRPVLRRSQVSDFVDAKRLESSARLDRRCETTARAASPGRTSARPPLPRSRGAKGLQRNGHRKSVGGTAFSRRKAHQPRPNSSRSALWSGRGRPPCERGGFLAPQEVERRTRHSTVIRHVLGPK